MNPFEQLVSSSLAGIPLLRGARCRGRHTLFDPQARTESDDVAAARHRQAIGLCVGITHADPGCPALEACRTWVQSLPAAQQPTGVVAGKLLGSPKAQARHA